MSEAKRLAALKAIDYVEDGMIVGVGTGSTVAYFIDALAAWKDRIAGTVSSSEQSTARLKSHGIEVIDLNAAGFTTLQTLLDASSEDLQQVEGVGPKTAQAILNWAQERAAKVGVEGEPASQEVQVPASAGGSTMNDQDFFAALSKALGESEQQAKQAEELALEAEADRSAEDDGSDPAGGGPA